jgi:hypothetical protein
MTDESYEGADEANLLGCLAHAALREGDRFHGAKVLLIDGTGKSCKQFRKAFMAKNQSDSGHVFHLWNASTIMCLETLDGLESKLASMEFSSVVTDTSVRIDGFPMFQVLERLRLHERRLLQIGNPSYRGTR